MVAISRYTGKAIDDYNHTIESLITLLTTPRQTRLYRRLLGSIGFEKIDAVITDDLKLDIFEASASALKIETRFKLDKVRINDTEANINRLYIDILGLYVPGNIYIQLEGIRII